MAQDKLQENSADRNIAATLFTTIQEICATDKVVSNIKDYPWYRFIAQLENADPEHEFVRLPAAQTAEGLVLSVRKPQLEECPDPPENLKPYLPANYTEYTAQINAESVLDGAGAPERVQDELARIEEMAEEETSDLTAAAEAMADAADGAEQVQPSQKSDADVSASAPNGNEIPIIAAEALPAASAGNREAFRTKRNAENDYAIMSAAGAGNAGLQDIGAVSIGEQLAEKKEQARSALRKAKQLYKDIRSDYLPPLTGKERAGAEKYISLREAWAERQRRLKQIADLFNGLLKIYNLLKQNANNFELLYAAGMLRVNGSTKFAHPLLTKRLDIRFSDLKNNILGLFDTEEPLKFEAAALTNLSQSSVDNKDQFLESVNLTDASLYSAEEITEFLKQNIHALSVHADFFEDDAHFYGDSKLIVKHQPLLILREKLSGLRAFTTQIIDYINSGKGVIPKHIPSVVSGELPFDAAERMQSSAETDPLGKELASVGGEHADIMLTKPANREQLSIVEEINASPAIVVQGPPGTGKTHTIANLIGHFLAEGKTLLITSEKDKALTVLQDKLEPEIRALCVPLLGSDRNKALSSSVNSILEKLSTPGLMDQLHAQAERYKSERRNLFDRLLDARKEVYRLRLRLNQGLQYQGVNYPLAVAAEFVAEYKNDAAFIPGIIDEESPLPLSESDLRFLYSTNKEITLQTAEDLSSPLPALNDLATPSAFGEYFSQQQSLEENVSRLDEKYGHKYSLDWENQSLLQDGKILLSASDPVNVRELTKFISELGVKDGWRKRVISAGLAGGSSASQWELLAARLETLASFVEQNQSILLTRRITFTDSCDAAKIRAALPAMAENVKNGDTGFSFMFKILHSGVDYVLENVSIDGRQINDSYDCSAVAAALEARESEREAQTLYNNLFAGENDRPLAAIDYKNIQSLQQFAAELHDLLGWKTGGYDAALAMAQNAGFNLSLLRTLSQLHNNPEEVVAYFHSEVAEYSAVAASLAETFSVGRTLAAALAKLKAPSLSFNLLAREFRLAIEFSDVERYAAAYKRYAAELEYRSLFAKRQELLARLSEKAPGWASHIERHIGAHGNPELLFDAALAWKARQLQTLLDAANSSPIRNREAQVKILSNSLKAKTVQLVSCLAWIKLLDRIKDNNTAVTNLRSWLSLRKRIGKGTGRYAAQYRRQAMSCMIEGRRAVPAWIAPVKTVFETFDPVLNHFDIAIFDEASQSSLEAIAVAFLADKVIVVGDDKQVSPMLVGRDDVVVNEILKSNLANLTRRWSMFDGKTSFYELLGSVYPTVMLREHFRCVPEIIGYSNEQFYDGRIIPLRDGNHNTLVPAVVNYHLDAKRTGKGKLNVPEQDACVALLLAMCEQPEYDRRTFGIISLLGDAQASAIERLVNEKVNSAAFMEERELICGNAASFQGDERDVIILTMVDDNDSARNITASDYSKRYNVAASRAKNQLWVVNSLDEALLAPDSLKFGLLEYSKNYPEHLAATVNRKSGSGNDLENEVADYLKQKGYHLDRNYVVGSFQLDLVVRCAHKAVVLECDAERQPSVPAKILSDLERQMVLERQGWNFLHLRGGTYYADKDSALENLLSQLAELGIAPEESAAASTDISLYERVTQRAAELQQEWQKEREEKARRAAEAEANKPKTLRTAATQLKDSALAAAREKNPKAVIDAVQNANELAFAKAEEFQERTMREAAQTLKKSNETGSFKPLADKTAELKERAKKILQEGK